MALESGADNISRTEKTLGLRRRIQMDVTASPRILVDQFPFMAPAHTIFGQEDVTRPDFLNIPEAILESQRPTERDDILASGCIVPIISTSRTGFRKLELVADLRRRKDDRITVGNHLEVEFLKMGLAIFTSVHPDHLHD